MCKPSLLIGEMQSNALALLTLPYVPLSQVSNVRELDHVSMPWPYNWRPRVAITKHHHL